MVEGMLDTGGHATIIDWETAQDMRLDVVAAVDGNYGHYHSPGYPPRPYAGVVMGPVPIRFSEEVVLQVPFIRVIKSSKRLVILGADVCAGGRSPDKWNFAGIPVETAPDGSVRGWAAF